MGTPREPFLKKGDRVLHRLTEKEGTVQAMAYRLDADRAHVQFDDGTNGEFASAELSLRKVVTITTEEKWKPPEEKPLTGIKTCNTCQNRCMDMDMDPYCAAVNKPWGKVLHRGIPKECKDDDGELKLWVKDTR